MQLGRWRWVFLGYSLFVLTLAVVLPYLVLLQAATAKAWARGFGLDNLTLDNFRYLFVQHAHATKSILNTFVYSSASATLAVGLALAVAYIVSRRLMRFSAALGLIAMTPIVVPGIVMAIGFYAAYAPPPAALAGTAAHPHPGVYHALSARRLLQRQCRHRRRQPGDGGRGAYPRRQPFRRACAGCSSRCSSAA